jgi:hypothetical protein
VGLLFAKVATNTRPNRIRQQDARPGAASANPSGDYKMRAIITTYDFSEYCRVAPETDLEGMVIAQLITEAVKGATIGTLEADELDGRWSLSGKVDSDGEMLAQVILRGGRGETLDEVIDEVSAALDARLWVTALPAGRIVVEYQVAASAYGVEQTGWIGTDRPSFERRQFAAPRRSRAEARAL